MRRYLVCFAVFFITMLPLGWAADDSPPIPSGFWFLEGTVDSGYVISDKEKNEFVWIPVKQPLSRVDWRNQTVLVSDTMEEVPPEISNFIKNNGGFYIGRYEAHIKKESMLRSQLDALGGLWPANWHTAKWACEKMAADYGYKDVISHLPYDAEWDAIMIWLKGSGISLDDSRQQGNYLDSPQRIVPTGHPWRLKMFQLNRIIDLAGNLREWTMARYGTNYRVVRGGAYDSTGIFESVSSRHYRDASTSEPSMGFRPALVIKDGTGLK